MVGLKHIVVKSHGRADRVALTQAIAIAATAVRRGLVAHVQQALTLEGESDPALAPAALAAAP
jgi:fatty acid/phospholipid biosynthesis enzyme